MDKKKDYMHGLNKEWSKYRVKQGKFILRTFLENYN